MEQKHLKIAKISDVCNVEIGVIIKLNQRNTAHCRSSYLLIKGKIARSQVFLMFATLQCWIESLPNTQVYIEPTRQNRFADV